MNRKICALVLGLAAFAFSPPVRAGGAASEESEANLKGKLFENVRPGLLRRGWQPLVSNEEWNGERINEKGMAKAFVDAGFVESDGCIDHYQLCMFYYTRAEECLYVVTRGPYVRRKSPRITVVQAHCYEPRLRR